MDFGYTEQQEMLRGAIRDLLARACPADYARRCDEEKRPPREAFEALAQAGWLGLGIPEEYGGQGGDQIDVAILLEEIGRSMVDLALWVFRVMVYGGQAVLHAGTDDQRSRILPAVARGEISTCFALTEPDSGSDAAALTTAASRDGDDYVIDGRKMFCSGFAVSDLVLIATRTDPRSDKHRGISLFLLDTRAPPTGTGAPTRGRCRAAPAVRPAGGALPGGRPHARRHGGAG